MVDLAAMFETYFRSMVRIMAKDADREEVMFSNQLVAPVVETRNP